MEYITHSRAETVALGEKMAAVLPAGSLVAFTGGLGAGKTAFCEGLAKGLGCLDPVSSPTFAIVNYYRGPRPLAHFDLYRISTEEDLAGAGFYDYLDEGAVVAGTGASHPGGHPPDGTRGQPPDHHYRLPGFVRSEANDLYGYRFGRPQSRHRPDAGRRTFI